MAAAAGMAVGAKASAGTGRGPGEDPIKLIYDGDLGPDPCDFAALSMLHEYHRRGHIKLLGQIGATPDPYLASTFSIYNQLYQNDIPIAAYNAANAPRVFSKKVRAFYDVATAGVCYRNQNRAIHEKFGTSETTAAPVPAPVELYRKLLAEAEDNSVILYVAGQLFNFPALLNSQPDGASPLAGAELLRRKIAKFHFMGGYFPRSDAKPAYRWTDNAEWNFWALGARDITRDSLAALAGMGKPITYVGAEIGPRILTGREIIGRLGREHPTSEAYYLYRPIAKASGRGFRRDNPAFDETALFVLVEGGVGKYFGEVEGSARVTRQGANTWVPGPGPGKGPGKGNERYITLLPGAEEELVKIITDRVTGEF